VRIGAEAVAIRKTRAWSCVGAVGNTKQISHSSISLARSNNGSRPANSREGVLTESNNPIIRGYMSVPDRVARVAMNTITMSDTTKPKRTHESKVLEQYFYDLYGVFMKRFSTYVLDPKSTAADELKLTALLQEMIKIRKLLQK
jgi:hypothetical protein